MPSHTGYSKSWIWLWAMLLLSSCQTKPSGLRSDQLMRSLSIVKKAVYYSMKSNVKRKSRNERTFFSPYHKPGLDLKMSSYLRKERGLLVITILGDRRPYQVEVQYRVEKRELGEYKLSHYDEGIAQHYLDRITDYLASRPEQRDIIDDFRVY